MYMTDFFICLTKSSCCSRMKIEKTKNKNKFLANLSSPRLKHIKRANFTSTWVLYPARREIGDSRAVTPVNTGTLVSRFLYSSVVFGVGRKRTVWMKL